MSGFKRLVVLIVITAWIFVVLPIAPTTAQAAPHSIWITVDGVNCTLGDAIAAANTDTAQGGCHPGDGPDTLWVVNSMTLNEMYPNSQNLLPTITSTITLLGNDNTISIAPYPPAGRYYGSVFSVATSDDPAFAPVGQGQLTIKNLSFMQDYSVALDYGFLMNEGGSIWLENVKIANIRTTNGYGAIISTGGPITLINCEFTHNQGNQGGVLWMNGGTLAITDSRFVENSAGDLTSDPSHGTGSGGAIYLNNVDFTLLGTQPERLLFEGNLSTARGGAIASGNSRGIIQGATFRSNSASIGGAIVHGSTARDTLAITESLFLHNQSTILPLNETNGAVPSGGGAIYNGGSLSVERVSFLANHAAYGGAIFGAGVVLLDTVTIVGNSADSGGGLFLQQGGQVLNSTIYANLAWGGNGGGILSVAKTAVHNSIVAENVGGDCFSSDIFPLEPSNQIYYTGSSNLDSDATCPDAAFVVGVEARAQDNGGNTISLALTAESNAIDAGNMEFCGTQDQRNASRSQPCDIGAFEYGAMQIPVVQTPQEVAQQELDQALEQERVQYAEQIYNLTNAIAADPTNIDLYWERAGWHMRYIVHAADALADYQKVLELDPTRIDAQLMITSLRLYAPGTQDCVLAGVELENLKALAPDRPEIPQMEDQLVRLCDSLNQAD